MFIRSIAGQATFEVDREFVLCCVKAGMWDERTLTQIGGRPALVQRRAEEIIEVLLRDTPVTLKEVFENGKC